jgi:hydroxyacylglutathione hydrolase
MKKTAVGFAFLFLILTPLHGQRNKSLEKAWGQFESAEPRFSQGLKAFKEGRYEDASAAFEKCLQKMPRHAYAYYYLANIAYIRKDYPQALLHMERSWGHFDLMQELDGHAGKLKLKKIDSYQQMLASEWDNTRDCRTSRELEAIAGQLTDEQSQLEILAQQQRDARAKQKAHYVYFLGNILFQLKRYPEAAQRYQEAIALNPGHASAYNNAAAICYVAGEYREALTYLERAEQQGLEDNINLRLKHLVHEALGLPPEGILQEDLSGPREEGLGVMRFVLAYKGGDAQLPPLYENAYVVYNRKTKQAVIIDPGADDPRIADLVKEQGLAVRAILNTHGHEDHAAADGFFAGLFGAPVYASGKDADAFALPAARPLEDGETLEFDGLVVRVIHTPGHTPGSLCFSIGDHLFSGDTLFKNSIGKTGTDDPDKTLKEREMLVRNIRQKLLTLPGQTRVCPGHGKTTTIADETANNPFLKK